MKKNTLYITLFSILMTILFLPMAQEHLKIFRLKSLGGVTEVEKKPVLSWDNYKNGRLQSQTEKYISKNFGFREWALRCYNQYVWSCYRKYYVNWIQRGPNDWLYQADNVEEYYQGLGHNQLGGTDKAQQHLRKQAQRIYDIQQVLKQNGTHFFFCFYPGKEVICPEHLPENTSYFKTKDFSAHDYLVTQFDSLGVNYIDFCKWFELLKNNATYPLFAKTGTHWTNVSSCYAADSIIHYLEHVGNINMHNLIISEPQPGKYRQPDADLEEILNLIFPIKKDKIPNTKVSIDNDPNAVRPKFINIGDSFYWNIVNNIPMRDIFSEFPYWYYNSTIYFDATNTTTKDIDYSKELLSADFVMLSYSTAQLYLMKGEFPQKAHLALCNLEERDLLTKKYRGLVNRIIKELQEPHQIERMREKASSKGITLEQALYDDAIWIINHKYNPDKIDIKALLENNYNDTENNLTSPSDSES